MGVFDPNAGKALMFLNYMANGNFRNKRRAGRAFNKMWDADEANRKQAWVSNLMSNPEPVMDAPNLMTDDEVMNKMNNKSLSLVDTSFRIPKNTVKTGTDWNAAALAMGDGKTMDDVRKFQQEAKAHGIDTGGVDGKFGNRTRQAWEAYKKNNNSWNTPGVTSNGSTIDINGNPVSTMYDSPNFLESWLSESVEPIPFKKPEYNSNKKRWVYNGEFIKPGTAFRQDDNSFIQYNTDGTTSIILEDDPVLLSKIIRGFPQLLSTTKSSQNNKLTSGGGFWNGLKKAILGASMADTPAATTAAGYYLDNNGDWDIDPNRKGVPELRENLTKAAALSNLALGMVPLETISALPYSISMMPKVVPPTARIAALGATRMLPGTVKAALPRGLLAVQLLPRYALSITPANLLEFNLAQNLALHP